MQQVHIPDNPRYPDQRTVQDATSIPALGHAEAAEMGTVELERFLALIELLSPDD